MTTDKNMLSAYLREKNDLDMPIPDELIIPLALQELQKRDTQLAEARKVIEPFVFANATNNEKRLLYNQLEERKAAAAYLAKYKETCSCKLPGFAVADPDTCPTCGKPHRAA